MKYGLTRYVYLYGYESQRAEKVIATAGDYVRSQMWCKKNVKTGDDGLDELLQTYAWAYFALRRLGRLAEFGIAPEPTQEGLIDMADRVSLYTEAVKDDELPLASTEEAER